MKVRFVAWGERKDGRYVRIWIKEDVYNKLVEIKERFKLTFSETLEILIKHYEKE